MKDHPKEPQATIYDIKLLFPVLFLVGIGIVMVYSASSALALKKYGSDYFFLKKQGTFALMGIITLVAFTHFPYRCFRALAYPLLAVALGLLIAVHLTGIGYSAGGSARWLRVAGLSFQPSEFARICMIVYLAGSMVKKADRIKEFAVGFLPHVLVLGVFIAMILSQPDFGSAVLLVTVTWIMLFVGGVRLLHLFAGLVVALPAAYFFHVPCGIPHSADLELSGSLAVPGGRRVSDHPFAHGIRQRRDLGCGDRQGIPEAVLSAGTPYGLYLLGDRGRTRPGGCAVHYRALLHGAVAGHQHRQKRRGHFRCPSGCGFDDSYRPAGVREHVGYARPAAHQGTDPALLSYGGTSLLLSMAAVGILMNIGADRQKS